MSLDADCGRMTGNRK